MDKKLGIEIHKTDLMYRRVIEGCEEMQRANSLTGTHGFVLSYLCMREGEQVFQRDIERVCGIRRSSVTELVQLMERNGLITRQGVPEDARLKQLVVTPKGKELHQATVDAFRSVERIALKGVDPKDLEVFYRVIEQLRNNLKEGFADGKCPSDGKEE
ncbi:MAG: winged helix-turn-helix transcriptional regulator [Clostridia bacterium]|nr:winged helix-turn-helix transcriptional regulator [Clostridia bacterium]